MIDLKNIDFSYRKGAEPALSGVTASIMPGIHLLAGENGAGKTTLLHVIAGVAVPTSGEVLIDGRNPSSLKPSELGRTFLLEENMLLPGKSIREFARRHSRFYPSFSQEAFDSNLQAFGLTGHEPAKAQSLGNRKKAQLAYALSLGVDVLLLDEPTNALDIESKATLRKLISSNLEENQTVIVATHTVSELENLFDGAIMLMRSRLLFAGCADAIAEKLAFRVTRSPEEEALYTEIQAGRALSICRTGEGEETKVDWRLFYSALHSPERGKVLQALLS